MESRVEKHQKMEKVKRKRLNVARTLVFVLVLYIIVCLGFYIYDEPIRHFEISGNKTLSDVDIIRYLKLEDYPSFVSINAKKLRKKLESNALVNKAKISYGWNFSIKIVIDENKPVFVYRPDNKICLGDGTLIDYDNTLAVGIPILLNNTPSKVMKLLANNMQNIEDGIIYVINDIEYTPSYNSNNQVIDENRFLLSMNDKNLVYVNAKKMDAINNYLDVIATDKLTTSGTFYFDGREGKYPFIVRSDDPNSIKTTAKVEDDVDIVDDAPIGEVINEN